MMKKCIIWGNGNDYEKLYNSIRLEVYKRNIEIVAVVSKKENIYSKYIDGVPLIIKEEVVDFEFDYIIISSSRFYREICDEIVSMGIERNRTINGEVFSYACFDFHKYVGLIEQPVTIISDDCWGGAVYHALSLPFSSPTININWQKEEYVRFISDLPYYLNKPLKCGREGNLETGEYPIGLLGDGNKQVSMELIHSNDFNEAKQQWDRRQKRINFNNIFVKFGMRRQDNWESYLEIFDKLPYNKICLFPYVRDRERYINSALFEKWRREGERKGMVDSYDINDYLRSPSVMRRTIDILSLLCGEKGCFRETDEIDLVEGNGEVL